MSTTSGTLGMWNIYQVSPRSASKLHYLIKLSHNRINCVVVQVVLNVEGVIES